MIEKSKKREFAIFMGILAFIFVLLGVTYAWYIYSQQGTSNHQLVIGDIYLTLEDNSDSISLTNIFPMSPEEARASNNNTLTFSVVGKNTTNSDVIYEVLLNLGAEETGKTRFNVSDLRFDLTETDENNVTTTLVSAGTYTELQDTLLAVRSFPAATNSEITRTYVLRAWLSDDVLISDTDPNADYPALTFKNHYASVKVAVNAEMDKVIGYITYDLNGKEGTAPARQAINSRLKGTINGTIDDPTFIGWSTTQGGDVEYRVGDPITFNANTTLYAVFETINVMNTFPTTVVSSTDKPKITKIIFKKEDSDTIDTKYAAATKKANITYNNQGRVLAWLSDDPDNSGKYIMYVESNGKTYFNTGKNLFSGYTGLQAIEFNNIDTSLVTNMSSMFRGCIGLTSLDVSNFNTSSVINTSQMFCDCSGLTSLNLGSQFNTSNVKYMQSMFSGCSGLTSLNLGSQFNTSSVTDIQTIFNGCSGLTSLNLGSQFNTSSVTNMTGMFNNCSKLKTIYIASSLTLKSGVTSANMFYGCTSLVGGAGTAYSSSNVTATYAKIDGGTSNPGYFTDLATLS